jgi:hypothetical protein
LATTIAGIDNATKIQLADQASFFLTATEQVITYGTDDAVALNEAFAKAREFSTAYSIVVPSGLYILKGTLNATNLNASVVHAYGAIFYGATAGKPIIDGLGTYQTTWLGLQYIGDQALPPNVGILIGRYLPGDRAFGLNKWEDISATGYFTLAGFYNMGSETTVFEKLSVTNHAPNAYAYVADGINHFGLRSDFVSISLKPDTPFTFTINSCVTCRFVAFGTDSSAVWTAAAASHSYTNSYVFAKRYGVVIYQASDIRSSRLSFDMNVEGPPSANFYIDGKNATALNGLTFSTGSNVATNSTFKINPAITAMKLRDLDLRMDAIPSGSFLFESASPWVVTGRITFSNPTKIAGHPSHFTGLIMNGDGVLQLYGATIQQDVQPSGNHERTTRTTPSSLAEPDDASKTRHIADGTAYAIPNNISLLAMVQRGTVASQTLTMPIPSRDGDIVRITTRGAIAKLTINAQVRGSVAWTPEAPLAADSGVAFAWDEISSRWMRLN